MFTLFITTRPLLFIYRVCPADPHLCGTDCAVLAIDERLTLSYFLFVTFVTFINLVMSLNAEV